MNQAHGKWTKKETNWSNKDTEFVKRLLETKAKPTNIKDIVKLHESLST